MGLNTTMSLAASTVLIGIPELSSAVLFLVGHQSTTLLLCILNGTRQYAWTLNLAAPKKNGELE
jgi:hypothetical protein